MLYSNLTNQYKVIKNVQFELIPQMETMEHIEKDGIIDRDQEMQDHYEKVKSIMDDYFRDRIEKAMSADVHLEGLETFRRLYAVKRKTSDEMKEFYGCQKDLFQQIKSFLDEGAEDYSKAAFLYETLPQRCAGDSEKLESLRYFKGYHGYFANFLAIRGVIFSGKGEHGSVAYRVISDNLPRYIDNEKLLQRIMDAPETEEMLRSFEEDFAEFLNGMPLEEYFALEHYTSFLAQSGIDTYNTLIGGISYSEKEKLQGINERINLYNAQNDQGVKLPLFKPLYKQILAESSSMSFRLSAFTSDQECLDAVRESFDAAEPALSGLKDLLCGIRVFDLGGIWVRAKDLNNLSKDAYGNWAFISNCLNDRYDVQNPKKKRTKSYYKKRKKDLDKITHYSIADICGLCGEDLAVYFAAEGQRAYSSILEAKDRLEPMLQDEYPTWKRLSSDDDMIDLIKDYMDALMAFRKLANRFYDLEEVAEKDEVFYGSFLPLCDDIQFIGKLYNQVRNFVTKKPYSTEKLRINFDNPDMMCGWSPNTVYKNGAILLLKDGKYYLGIANKACRKYLPNIPDAEEGVPSYQMPVQYAITNAKLQFPKTLIMDNGEELFGPDEDVNGFYKSGTFRTDPEDMYRMIDYYKSALQRYEKWFVYQFRFRPTREYASLDEFYADAQKQCLRQGFRNVPEDVIRRMVRDGQLYLFQLYCKDFSPYSKGRPNLNTMYFEQIFSKENLEDSSYKLSGGGQIFYRKASIDPAEAKVHPKNEVLKNKNPLNPKKTSLYDYDLIKNRRYTVDKMHAHLCITMNYMADGNGNINHYVNALLREDPGQYIIGVNRGERNLIYVVVVDPSGEVVEQRSLNIIRTVDADGVVHETDYLRKLIEREEARDEQQRSWKSMDSIKNLKEGYLSVAIHEITDLMRKYNAVLVVEDLSASFSSSRQKIERQVYQKFESMLLTKLGYLVDKDFHPYDEGGLMNALQLASKFESLEKVKKQSGVVLFLNPGYISNMDPATGFVNLFFIRYESVRKAQEFFGKFDSIRYDVKRNMFAFEFDYRNFTTKMSDTKTRWTVYTHGERLYTRKENGRWTTDTIFLTEAIQDLLEENGIEYENGKDLLPAICGMSSKKFFEELMLYLRLTVQMRNAVTNSDEDFIISPVMAEDGTFFDSRDERWNLPINMDSAGAYNMARKGRMALDRIAASEEGEKVDLYIDNEDWIRYAQGI